MLKPQSHAFSEVSPRLVLRTQSLLPRQTAGGHEDGTKVSAFAGDFITCALLTAVTASMVNARADGRALKITRSVSDYKPQPLAMPAATVRDSGALFFNETLTESLAAYCKNLRAALSVTPEATVVWTETTPSTQHNWRASSVIWQSLCGEVRQILLALCEFNLLGGSDEEARMLEIEQLIKTARYGGTPCIRMDGSVVVPGWLDGRREVRIPLGVTVWIETKYGRQRSVLKDVSMAGMGLSSCPALTMGSAITVTLPNGMAMYGSVTWCHGGFVGACFTQRLTESDPIYKAALALSRASRRLPLAD
jgi:PilZ domain